MNTKILIVDDELRLADVLHVALEDRGYQTRIAASGNIALRMMEVESFDLVLTDLRMPDLDGRALLQEIKRRNPDMLVVILTAYASMRDAVDLVKEGAFDYIAKPFEMEDVAATLSRALKLTEVVRDNERLRAELEVRYSFKQLIGTSPLFQRVIEQISSVCESRTTVMILGETGTGKELVARALHFNSPRANQPFVAINCAAIPDGLLESELFGHVKGAFTGALSARVGRFAQADGGTLFLDEIGDMPIPVQSKILRILQERTFELVGSNETQEADVRIVTATHKNLRNMVSEGKFREDLFYRLNVFPIDLPSLRARIGDLPLLARHFLKLFSESMGKRIEGFAPDALKAMNSYHWPGNIRELQNCIERAVIVSRSSTIGLNDLPSYVFEDVSSPDALFSTAENLDAEMEKLERAYIVKALESTNGAQNMAARLLGINERSLWHRIKKLNIKILRTPD